MKIILGTRKSKLAQIQADRVSELLFKECNIESEKLLVVTEGDRRLDVTLDKIGGKGVFIKEIERALILKEAHGAVHSLKDVPHNILEEFEIVAIPEREDTRDAFISREGISFWDLEKGARIATGSIRREAQLKLLRDDIEVVPIRGNVQRRLQKMEEEKLDGIILASAGLQRLGISDIITNYFSVDEIVPAVGQGALAIETLVDSEYKKYFKKIHNESLGFAIEAERSFMKELNGGCHTVIGANSIVEGEYLYLVGIFQVGNKIIKKDIEGKLSEAKVLGEKLAKKYY